jgi:hypothetical protein
MEVDYKAAKEQVKEVVKAVDWSATPESTWSDFQAMLTATAEGEGPGQEAAKKLLAATEVYVKTYFEELVSGC